jgi:hypothetical protein
VTELPNYSLPDIVIPEVSSCKYLGIILHSDLSCAAQVNYTVKKAWKALVLNWLGLTDSVSWLNCCWSTPAQ